MQFFNKSQCFFSFIFGNDIKDVHFQGLALTVAVHVYGTFVPGRDIAFKILHSDGVVGVPDHGGQASIRLAIPQSFFRALYFRNIHKGNDNTVNYIFYCAIRRHPNGKPIVVCVLNFSFFNHQCVKHFL